MQKKSHKQDPAEFVKIMGKELPIEELRTNLARVARSRGLLASELRLHFRPNEAPYYNIYKYAFFGKIPEVDIDPRARLVRGRAAKAKLFKKR